MPAGARVGTFVHRVLEATDFAAADLDAELAARVADELRAAAGRRRRTGRRSSPGCGRRSRRRSARPPAALRLRDVARADRLDELDFELPLAGGDAPAGRARRRRRSPPSCARTRPPATRSRPTPTGSADPALRQEVRGYLTGSIDLVVRLPGERFAVVDYKTNWLGGADAELTAWHHRPAALAEEMRRAHYWLQALLYTVALHRYLRWRLPGYAPERNLAGVLYLFLRGMTGAATPRRRRNAVRRLRVAAERRARGRRSATRCDRERSA